MKTKSKAMHRPLLTTLLLLLLGISTAGPSLAQGVTRSADRVQIRHFLSHSAVPAGDTLQVLVLLDIAEGWAIQAAKPSFDYLVPTSLLLEPPEGITVSTVAYGAARTKQFAFAEGTLAVYDGETPLRFTVTVPEDAPPGPHVIRGRLTYQACDHSLCLAPSTTLLEIPFEVVPAGTAVQTLNEPLFAMPAGEAGLAATGASEWDEQFKQDGLLLTFLSLFLIGLALNLTPCVYPMLSVTVSIFGSQTESRTVRVFFKAVVYVLGICTMYSVLGVIAALTGGLFGAVLQNSWVLFGIALLLFALALSMFGLYDLQVPPALANRIQVGGASAGWIGVYLSGLVVGVFAAPCIGPPVIALLAVVGAKGDPWFGLGSFFVLSLGLGAPYLVLGTFSGLLKKMPRSGAWMVWVKKIFGVILVGVSLFYFSLAFFPNLLPWIPALLLIPGGLYLGFMERSGNERPRFRRMKRLTGTLCLIGGISLLTLQPKSAPGWEPYHEEALNAARLEKRPVVLDFYADWCIPCHELELRTFTHPDVIKALASHRKLKVDLTRSEDPVSLALIETYGVQGVPTILFLDGDGNEVPQTRVLGFLPPKRFLEQIAPALENP